MEVNHKYLNIKPSPRSGLDVTSKGIWVSWTKMTDKEIMRETAMKGTTFDLASNFLSARNNWSICESKHWLQNEINCWALDLLNRSQIHKAIHIYQINGKDAFGEIINMLLGTTDEKLRCKLKEHLVKNSKWTDEYEKHWVLFNALRNQNYFVENEVQEKMSFVLEQSENWKLTLGTKIFFKTYDMDLEPFLDSKTCWIFLLKENPHLIEYWINIQYRQQVPDSFGSFEEAVVEKLNKVFTKLQITQEIVDSITECDISDTSRALALGELSKFGIFSSQDKNSIENMITHVVRTNNIENLDKIFSQPGANVNLNEFSELLVSYCLENNLEPLLNMCVSSINLEYKNSNLPYINLMLTTRQLCESKNCDSISSSLVEVSRYLCKEGLLSNFFHENPLILLAIALFQKVQTYDLFLEKPICGVNPIEGLKTIHFLITEHEKMKGTLHPKPLTHLDLLEKHAKINVQLLYPHRYSNNIENLHFNNSHLLAKYGYQKEVSFDFFIKQLRPCYAYKKFTLKQIHSNLNQNYIMSCEQIERLAIKNILNKEIINSCVNFIEMLNGKSYALRIYVSSAEIIYKSKVKDKNQISQLFSDVDMNCDEIFNNLQLGVMKKLKHINLEITGRDLIMALKEFDILIKFSSLHNIKLPDALLKLFAEQDLWLEFLIFIQIYNYPLETILKSTQYFKTPSITEHIEHCFKNDIPKLEEQGVHKERDPKKYFFSKMGLRASERYATSEVSSLSSYGSMTNSFESDILETEALNPRTDLLLLFIKCHNSVDPPKAFQFACRYYRRPLLAVFAMCYEPDSLLTNWLTWLEVSCNVDITHFNPENVVDSDSVLKCFRTVLREGYFKTLLQSYFIFLNENPLRYFLEFINECLLFHFTENTLIKTLHYFSKKLIKTRRNSFVGEVGSDIHFINNKVWIQNTAIYIIGLTLQYGYKSCYDKILFIKFLCEKEIGKYFSVACPNFKIILKMLEYLFENNYNINFDLSVINNHKKFKREMEDFISELLKRKEYYAALNLAEISDLPTEMIVLEHAQFEFASKKDYYWLEIEDIFKNSSFPPLKALDFFQEISQDVSGFEKYALLKIAYNWCETHKLPSKYLVEKLLWLAFFEMDNCVNHLALPDDDRMIFYSEYSEELDKIEIIPCILNEIQMENLKKTSDALLGYGDLKRSMRLGRMFGFSTSDLDILKLCLMLAEGTVSVDNLTFEQRLLLVKKGTGAGKHLKRTSTRLFSCSSALNITSISTTINTSDYQQSSPVNDTLSTLETLSENLLNGTAIATRIVRTYRSSLNLRIKYKDVVHCRNPLIVLKKALSADCDNKLEVISDFVHIFKLSKQEIADLVCAELVDAVTIYSKSVIEVYFLWDVNIETNFNLILQLLTGDCTILGMKLFNLASTTHQSQMQMFTSNEDNVLISELLIKSHDCFTADCNMEGISIVLKKCQSVITSLISIQNWKLIIRLLTGIKRYSEMNYVFPILKENGQFELLLRKGSRKDIGLKTALLEYLKRYCPEDVELYKIVALHFFLFSEIAELWEHESALLIKRLIQIAKMDVVHNKPSMSSDNFIYFTNSDDTKKILGKIMKNYRHAAEYHLNGSKVAKSMKTAQQAKLVALQLSLFKNLAADEPCICLFKLSNNQINKLLLGSFSFFQGMILIKAYDYKIDWAPILFEQYVVRGSPDFLNHFLITLELSKSLLHEISRKFLSYQNPNEQMIHNMKNILNKFGSVHTKYRIASELGFTDIVEGLLEGNQLCYLKDTVWKNGYRNTDT